MPQPDGEALSEPAHHVVNHLRSVPAWVIPLRKTSFKPVWTYGLTLPFMAVPTISSFRINVLLTELAMSKKLVNAQLRLWFPFYKVITRYGELKDINLRKVRSRVSGYLKLPNYADLLTAPSSEPRAFLNHSVCASYARLQHLAKRVAGRGPSCANTYRPRSQASH